MIKNRSKTELLGNQEYLRFPGYLGLSNLLSLSFSFVTQTIFERGVLSNKRQENVDISQRGKAIRAELKKLNFWGKKGHFTNRKCCNGKNYYVL
jgi:hypothetical protein